MTTTLANEITCKRQRYVVERTISINGFVDSYTLITNKYLNDGQHKIMLWMDEAGNINKTPVVGFLMVESASLPDYLKYKSAITNAEDLRTTLAVLEEFGNRVNDYEFPNCGREVRTTEETNAHIKSVLLPELLRHPDFIIPDTVVLGLYHPYFDDYERPGWTAPAEVIEAEPTIGCFAPFAYDELDVDVAKYAWVSDSYIGLTMFA